MKGYDTPEGFQGKPSMTGHPYLIPTPATTATTAAATCARPRVVYLCCRTFRLLARLRALLLFVRLRALLLSAALTLACGCGGRRREWFGVPCFPFARRLVFTPPTFLSVRVGVGCADWFGCVD